MRFAVIANVQANLDALFAVLQDIDERHPNVDRIVCAGDLVGLGPQPNEVLDLLRAREIESVRGNYDDAIALGRSYSGIDYADEDAERTDNQALAWTQHSLTEVNLNYLRDLPRDLRLSPGGSGIKVGRNEADEREMEYKRTFFVRAIFGGMFRAPVTGSKRVLVMHGSPRALNEFVREQTANSILAAVARDTQADVLVTAHATELFRRDAHGMIFIGAGRVSDITASPGEAQYVYVNTGEDVTVDFGGATYDLDRYLGTLRASGLPPSLKEPAQLGRQA